MACRSLRPELLLLPAFLQCLLHELLALSVGAEDSGKSAWTMEHGTTETEGKSPEFQGRWETHPRTCVNHLPGTSHFSSRFWLRKFRKALKLEQVSDLKRSTNGELKGISYQIIYHKTYIISYHIIRKPCGKNDEQFWYRPMWPCHESGVGILLKQLKVAKISVSNC